MHTIALVACALAGCRSRLDVPVNTNLTQATHGDKFPIDAAPHDLADCNVCHGGTSSFRQFSCMNGTCHPGDEATSQHATVLGFELAAPGCYGCHKRGTAAGAPDHSTLFPIGPGQSHGWVPCAACHMDPDVRAVVTCAIEGCHGEAATQAQHAAVADYTWTSAACVTCHPNGIVPAP